MRIIEKGCDPSIKLAKFKFNCDECDTRIQTLDLGQRSLDPQDSKSRVRLSVSPPRDIDVSP